MSAHPSGGNFFFLLLAADVVVDVGGSEGQVRFSHFTTDTSLTH